MKRLLTLTLLCGLPLTLTAEMNQYKAEARQITGAFFQELKGELGKGLKAGGPVLAAQVCKSIAPAIAQKHSANSGWDVGRTSLKLRNPDNAPDAWETRVLQEFAARRAEGEGADTLAYAEIVNQDGEKHFRFMKGIVMPPLEKMPCLMCHGENMAPDVAARIDTLYPQDQARGYKAGQVRGAFTLKKKL
jgi:hypothetical protein